MIKFFAFFYICFIPCFGHSTLSLEEKVGQLLMVHFHGKIANEEAKILIEDIKVGGIIYYNWANSLHSPHQVRILSTDLQKMAKNNPTPIPLLIAADQEGGSVARLRNGFTQFPGNRALSESGNPQFVKAMAYAMGQELRDVGINMNLAPVVDVNSNPYNPIIGIRSFSQEVDTVVLCGRQALEGFQEAQVIATLKHFPGYGDISIDPHHDLPIIHKTKEELENIDLQPFKSLTADAIMTAHILVPALDPNHCSTLSETTLSYLREEIGFKGVIIADSLVMEGVIKKCCTVDEAAILALKAGCDILILGGKLLDGEQKGFELNVTDVKRIHHALINAVKSGRISEERLNKAVEKILNLKKQYLINEESRNVIDLIAHQKLAQEIASHALKVVKKEDELIVLSDKNVVFFAPASLKDHIIEMPLIGKTTKHYFFSGSYPSNNELDAVKNSDILFICSYNAWKNPEQNFFIQSLINAGKIVILTIMGDPLDADLFPKAHYIFNTFSPSPASIQAVINYLDENRPLSFDLLPKEDASFPLFLRK